MSEIWDQIVIGDKNLNQWFDEKTYLGPFDKEIDLSPYSACAGLYMFYYNDRLQYVGRALEFDHGRVRKRLMDYVRSNDGSRKTYSGRSIFKRILVKKDVHVFVIVTGYDVKASIVAAALEPAMILMLRPSLNAGRFNAYRRLPEIHNS